MLKNMNKEGGKGLKILSKQQMVSCFAYNISSNTSRK